MKTIKIMTMTAMLAAFVAALVIVSAASPTADDAATTYKTKCVACHGQKAEKKFDSSLPDEQLIEIVMKGKKPEKPPNMPAYEKKRCYRRTGEGSGCPHEAVKERSVKPPHCLRDVRGVSAFLSISVFAARVAGAHEGGLGLYY